MKKIVLGNPTNYSMESGHFQKLRKILPNGGANANKVLKFTNANLRKMKR